MRIASAVVVALLVPLEAPDPPGLLAGQSDSPRNDLPQPYRTTRDWDASSVVRAASLLRETTPSTSRTPNQVTTPGRGSSWGIREGIRVGSARDGKVTAFIEDMESTAADHSGAEGVGVDANGNVYGAIVRRQMLERHIKKQVKRSLLRGRSVRGHL